MARSGGSRHSTTATTIAQKRMSGRPGQLPEVNIVGSDVELEMPKGMTAERQRVWERVVKFAPWLNATNEVHVEMLVVAILEWRELDAYFAKRGRKLRRERKPVAERFLADEREGKMRRPHALYGVYRESATTLRTLCGHAGINPREQTRMLTLIDSVVSARQRKKSSLEEEFLT